MQGVGGIQHANEYVEPMLYTKGQRKGFSTAVASQRSTVMHGIM